jgi:hypothetical protein
MNLFEDQLTVASYGTVGGHASNRGGEGTELQIFAADQVSLWEPQEQTAFVVLPL